jgi:hypothetical protein
MTDDNTTTFTLTNDNKVPKTVVTVIVHPTVTVIKYDAFYGCTSLASITIPDLVTNIGNAAFFECTSLTSIILPDQITNIGDAAFSRCTSLTSIIMPDLLTNIEEYAFNGCTSLTSITIPDLVTNIGNGAFIMCTSLTSIIIPEQLTYIGYHAFAECTSLTSIILPEQLTTIGYRAFNECTSLEQRQPNGKNYHANINIWLQHRFDDLPLHQACYNNYNKNALITRSILQNLIQQHASSMITVTDAMLMTPLHILCCNPTATLEMIQLLKAAQPHAASMRNVMNKTPLMMLLESKSHEKYNALHDADGQLLPLAGLLEQGLDFEALEMIMSLSGNNIFVSELKIEDLTSGLLPFMYGASLGNCGLDVVYELAMKLPDLLTRMH